MTALCSPTSFVSLGSLIAILFNEIAHDKSGIEILEIDVFDHGDNKQVVCWNANESVNLGYHYTR